MLKSGGFEKKKLYVRECQFVLEIGEGYKLCKHINILLIIGCSVFIRNIRNKPVKMW